MADERTYRPEWNPATRHPWECKCLLEHNLVLRIDGYMVIGFEFEAYPNQYIFKGQGRTAEDAEDAAWASYQQAKDRLCKHSHADPANCERRTYRNGCGFCIHCGMFVSNVFEPLEVCCQCGKRTYWTDDKNGKWWCEECAVNMPVEVQAETYKSNQER